MKNSEMNRERLITHVLANVSPAGLVTREQVAAVVDVFRTFTVAREPFAPFGNRFGVAVLGEEIPIVGLGVRIPRDAALNLGTWLLVLGDFTDEQIATERRRALGSGE